MKTVILSMVALASLTIASSAYAGLGWSLDECRQHYGQEDPENHSAQATVFNVKGYEIDVWFLNQKVSRIAYCKSSPLLDNIVPDLLDQNAPDVHRSSARIVDNHFDTNNGVIDAVTKLQDPFSSYFAALQIYGGPLGISEYSLNIWTNAENIKTGANNKTEAERL
jgi:hypothetical protein